MDFWSTWRCLEQRKLQGKSGRKLENGLYFGENLEERCSSSSSILQKGNNPHVYINPLGGVQLVGKARFFCPRCSLES